MVNPEIMDALTSAQPFKYLDQHELKMLVLHSKVISFEQGNVIVQQGKRSKGLYIIINGVALVTAKTLGKDILKLLTIEHGNFAGEMGLLDQSIYATTVIANTHLTALLIPNEYFEMLAVFFPNIKYKISKAMTEEICNRLKKIYEKIIQFMTQSNMVHLSLFDEIVKSLSTKKEISFTEAELDSNRLQELEFFNLFTSEEIQTILKDSKLVMAPKGCVLRKEGEMHPPCYIIMRGAVQSAITQKTKVAKLAVLGPVELFGSISMIDGCSTLISYTAREKTILLEINASQLDHIEKNHLEIWYKLYDLICKSFAKLERAANKLDIRLHSELYNR